MATVNPSPADPGRWTQAVQKLVQLTRDGRIKWTRGQPRPRVGLLAILETAGEDVYEAQHDGQRLRVRRWIDSRPQRGLLGFVSSPYQYELELIDHAGETIWTFPSVSDLADLYQAIRFYEAGVGPYIDRLLAEP